MFLFILSAVAVSGIVFASFSAWITNDTVRITPSTIALTTKGVQNTSGEKKNALLLFDRDTTSTYAPSETTFIDVNFTDSIALKYIKVFGSSSYHMTVYLLKEKDNWVEVNGLNNIDLSSTSKIWQKIKASSNIVSGTYRLKFEPIESSGTTLAGMAEIEFWAEGQRVNIKDGETFNSLMDEINQFSSGKKLAALPLSDSVTITRENEKTTVKEAVFTVNIPMQNTDIKRAWLVYELNGFANWISVEYTINGKGSKKSWPMAGTDGWVKQVEPVNPELFVGGNNEIRFTLPEWAAVGYSARNLNVLIETDSGFNHIGGIETQDEKQMFMIDGDTGTTWKPSAEESVIVFDTNRTVQPDCLGLQVSGIINSSLKISGLHDGVWEQAGNDVNASGLDNGWNTIQLFGEKSYEKIRLEIAASSGTTGGISEAFICGSGTGKARKQEIVINYPDKGQYYGRSAYISGYLPVMDNGSGTAQVLVGPNPVQIKDGVFSAIVSKENLGLESDADSAPWSVDVTVIYPDGARIVKTVYLNAIIGYDASQIKTDNNADSTYGFGVKAGDVRKLKIKDVELEIDASDEDKTTDIQVLELEDRDIPSLDTGMVNVTKKYKGYRFLPHHSKFKKKMTLRIPFDKKKLPAGKTCKDVGTYYFNDNINRWMPVETSQIDEKNEIVESLTDHFTDFINATIVVPDHQEIQNFNPNQLKDLKAAVPGEGITLVSIPEANNRGDAVMDFVIDSPPGRQGIKPQIKITYNANNDEGLLGIGWDMPIGNISCDTKYGVPRYDSGYETEIYLLDGEELLPNGRTIKTVREGSGKRFFSRIEKDFKRIVRNNSTPQDYWWQVTNKDGSINVYGDADGCRLKSTSSDPTGAVFLWYISRTIDKNGNEIDYGYAVEDGESVLKTISYNNYQIRFSYGNRTYPRLNCRGGFKRNFVKLLASITIVNTAANSTIRGYSFDYSVGAFGKNRLDAIRQTDSSGSDIPGAAHAFNYYDDRNVVVNTDGTVERRLFSSTGQEINLNVTGEDLENLILPYFNISIPSLWVGPLANATLNNDYGEFDSVTWGVLGDNSSNMHGRVTRESHQYYKLMDINGDGIVDEVYTGNGSDYYFKPGVIDNLGMLGFGSSTQKFINGLGNIIHETITSEPNSETEGTKVSGDCNSNATTNQYMLDVNSDGIPDFINNAKVYFGRKMDDGSINYTSDDSALTDFPIIADANVIMSALPESVIQAFYSSINTDPLVDTIKKWVAPFAGEISINAPVSLVQYTDAARIAYTTADGVIVSMQQNNDPLSLWSESIAADDYSVHNTAPITKYVNAGDRIYFRVQSVYDGKYDTVNWSPVITYTGISPFFDANNLNMTVYNTGLDFTLAGRRSISLTMKFKGTIRLSGDLASSSILTDNVTMRVLLTKTGTGTVIDINNSALPGQSLAWNMPGTIAMSSSGELNSYREFSVDAGDQLSLIAEVDTNIDLSKISWQPSMYYTYIDPSSTGGITTTVQNESGEYIYSSGVPYDIIFYPKNVNGIFNQTYTVKKFLLDPQPAPILESTQTLALWLKGDLTKVVTTQDVRISLIINSDVDSEGFLIDGTGTKVDVALIPQDVSGTAFSLPNNYVHIPAAASPISPINNIRIVLTTGNQADINGISWNPVLDYVVLDNLGNIVSETPAVEMPMPYEANLTTDDITRIRNMYISPRFARPVDTVDIAGNLIPKTFTVSAKETLQLKGKYKFSILPGITQKNIALGDLTPGEILYFECFTNLPENYTTVGMDEPIHVPGVKTVFYPNCTKYSDLQSDLFPIPYRGWASAGLNGNPPSTGFSVYDMDTLKSQAAAIDESKFTYDSSLANTGQFSFNPSLSYRNLDGYIIPDSWRSVSNNYSTGQQMVSSRKGLAYIIMLSAGNPETLTKGEGKANAVNRLSNSTNDVNSDASWKTNYIPFVSYSNVFTSGLSDSLLDFMDLNGDGFPDVIWGDGNVQYSNSGGGLNGYQKLSLGDNGIRSTTLCNNQASVDISFGFPSVSGSGDGTTSSGNTNSGNNTGNNNNSGDTGSNNASSNTSSSGGGGSGAGLADIARQVVTGLGITEGVKYSPDTGSALKHDLIDLNGDGLPDMVFADQNKVLYNLGYLFTEVSNTTSLKINNTKGAGFEFHLGIGGGVIIGGGFDVSASVSGSRVMRSMVDVNGDGLPDLLYDDPTVTGDAVVQYNTGLSYLDAEKISSSDGIGNSWSIGFGGSLVATVGGSLFDIATLQYGHTWSRSASINKQPEIYMDVNGDGFADRVQFTIDSLSIDTLAAYATALFGNNPNFFANTVTIFYNVTNRTNLLQSVTRPLGAVFTLDYNRSVNTYDMPKSRWNLKQVTVDDGVNDSSTSSGLTDNQTIDYTYDLGRYDKYERDFYGYRSVVEKRTLDASLAAPQKRITERIYDISDYYKKGLLLQEKVKDNAGIIHTQTDYTYTARQVYDDAAHNIKSWFVPLTEKVETTKESLTDTGVMKTYNYLYDDWGNLQNYSEKGSESTGLRAHVAYNIGSTAFVSTSALPSGPVDLPLDIRINASDDGSGMLLRHRTAAYDSSGNVLTVSQQIDDTSSYALTAMTYDPSYNNNLLTVTLPPNQTGQQVEYSYTYDPATDYVFVKEITKHMGTELFMSEFTYDTVFNKVHSIKDQNDKMIYYDYDTVGRLAGITGPNDTYSSGGPYTVSYEYHPFYAVVFNKDKINNPIKTITFADGLGRVIQVKKDASVDSAGVERMIVSGRTVYDNGGRVRLQYYPSQEEKGPEASGNADFASTIPAAENPTTYSYDAFDRTTGITFPDNSAMSFAYSEESGRLKTLVTDSLSNAKATYKDSDQRIRQVLDISTSPAATITTNYLYDPIGEMINVVDQDTPGNSTTVRYDMLGRRMEIYNADSGSVKTAYDAASNPISKLTSKLASPITYTYKYDQMVTVTYPGAGTVAYEYGADGDADNAAGRIKKVTYGAGSREMKYDNMGNIRWEESKIIPQDSTAPMFYDTSYTWDSFGRMTDVTYPDPNNTTAAGETVYYDYDFGGLVKRVTGDTTYVSSVLYDKFGKRKKITYGNGMSTDYTYVPSTQRLNTLKTYAGTDTPHPIQSLEYGYDTMGNITDVTNEMMPSSVSLDTHHKIVTRSFEYDGFYRLIDSSATLDDKTLYPSGTATVRGYDLTMNYDDIAHSYNLHNITGKNQNVYDLASDRTTHNTDLMYTYDNQYSYDSSYIIDGRTVTRPHAAHTISNGLVSPADPRDYSYDASGNNLGYSASGINISLTWDAENRLSSWNNNAGMSENYWYNEAGSRIIKKNISTSGNSEFMYPNQFTGIDYSEATGTYSIMTKNIYMGTERIVSKLVNMPDGTLPDDYTYYYHTDHLGSTAFLTDDTPKVVEHIEYTPWGESWVSLPATPVTPLPKYKFTSKELDMTGLYYYGARYYDPQVSLWMSTDPILEKYLESDEKGGGGILDSMNLPLYSYGEQSPIRYVDPDGNNAVEPMALAASMSISYSSAYASYRLAHGSASGAIFAGSVAAIAAGTVNFFDPTDVASVMGASMIGAAIGNWGAQMIDINKGFKKEFSYGGFLGALAGGGALGGVSLTLTKFANAALGEIGASLGTELLTEGLFSVAFDVSGIFGEYVGEGIGDSFNFKVPEIKLPPMQAPLTPDLSL